MNEEKIEFITDCAKEACMLEVKAKKPGNVNPKHDFSDTTFKDFMAGARALKPIMREAATRGFRVGTEVIPPRGIGIGSLVKAAIEAVAHSHSGGNTHLGISMLLVPLTAAAGMCAGKGSGFEKLRENITLLLDRTTVDDCLNLCEAINLSNAGSLGSSELDIRDENSKIKIKEEFIRFIDILRMSAERDRIAYEIANYYPITLEIGVPLMERLGYGIKNPKDRIVQLFLVLLSRFPDTLIARKTGIRNAEHVSKMAKDILDKGGLLTGEGKAAIGELDNFLRSDGNKLNPGTTADLVTSSVFVNLLLGKE